MDRLEIDKPSIARDPLHIQPLAPVRPLRDPDQQVSVTMANDGEPRRISRGHQFGGNQRPSIGNEEGKGKQREEKEHQESIHRVTSFGW